MPLLKGKFRPATRVARSHSTSESEPRPRSTSFSEYETQKRNQSAIASKLATSLIHPAQSSAFKVPVSPIIVGLSSPKKLHTSLFCPSPRKIPTTPFSPSSPFSPGRPSSPHFIQPPPIYESPVLSELTEDSVVDVVNNEIRVITEKDPSHAIQQLTTTKVATVPEPSEDDMKNADELESHLMTIYGHKTEEESDDSVSVTSSQTSGSSAVRRKKDRNHKIEIDKSTMTIADVINLRVPRNPENPLTKVWSDLKQKALLIKDQDIAKEVTRKDRIKQLLEEASARGEVLTEQDIEEVELPPIEVEVDDKGNIVVNKESLEVKLDSQTDIQETVIEDETVVTFGKYEDHKVSVLSYSRRKQSRSVKWDNLENDRFYLALRKVGTDFDLMQKIMPTYSRDQLKRKFKREEKLRLAKVDMALKHSMKLDDKELEKPPMDEEEEPPKPKPRRKRKVRYQGHFQEDLGCSRKQRDDERILPLKRHRPTTLVISDSDDDQDSVKSGRTQDKNHTDPDFEPFLEYTEIITVEDLKGKIIL